jgi:octaprenyl-diphosphate synthase
MSTRSLSSISAPVAAELVQFEQYMRGQMKSKTALVDTVVRYIMRSRGKRVRPALVFLAAGVCGGVSNRAFVGAAMVELLHTATLVHDDVVDSSMERRGMASINAIWKNKIAVLVGDYLLSKGLMIAVTSNEFEYLKVTSNAVRRMSEGELLQMQKSRQKQLDEETYFRIIADKTASLISTCCEVGALSTDCSSEQRNALQQYGEFVGLAFQIRDDVLDYTSRTAVLGKPIANDIREGKITLPLLYASQAASESDSKRIIALLKRKRGTDTSIQDILQFVRVNKGVEQAQEKAYQLKQQAIRLLTAFPPSAYKTALEDFAHFVVERSK